ncbi:MAG: hypothetical protein U1D96_02055 [Eubacteriales bacterium]|nr:hypothetical protein [Eubacteriales bacterium]MDZ7609401.1 hypothetical protein [Eubacteriales bacterium]
MIRVGREDIYAIAPTGCLASSVQHSLSESYDRGHSASEVRAIKPGKPYALPTPELGYPTQGGPMLALVDHLVWIPKSDHPAGLTHKLEELPLIGPGILELVDDYEREAESDRPL